MIEKKKLGRPSIAEEGTAQVAIRVPMHVLEALDRVIADGRGAADRAKAFREALADYIEKCETRRRRTR